MTAGGAGTEGLARRQAQPQPEWLYRLLVESVRDYAIFALDRDGHVLTWNRGAEQIKGYAAGEILGSHYRVFYTDEARANGDPERQLELAAREGRYEGEGWRVRRDGTRFWARVVATALVDPAGEVVGFGKVTSDMTAERNAQLELRRRERQLAEAQQIAHLGSWDWSIAEDRVRWSEQLYRIAGMEPEQRIDLDRQMSLVHPEDRQRVRGLVQRSVELGEPFVLDHRLVRPSGEIRWIHARGEPIRDEHGRVLRLHGTVLDVTEVREAERQARRLVAERTARAEAERTAKRMGFLAEASALLGESLDDEETLRTIAWTAVPSFADWCAVDIVQPDGTLQRLAVAHIDPGRVRLVQELGQVYQDHPDAPLSVAALLRSGEPQLIEELAPEALADDGAYGARLEHLRRLGVRSAILVPLRAGGERTLGAVTFVIAESDRSYVADDLVVARELAGRAALAIENAQLHMAEREARRHAEAARERTARLQDMTAALSEALTPESVASVMVEGGAAALGASTGVLGLAEEDGGVHLVRFHGFTDRIVEQYEHFPRDAPVPLAEALRTGELVLVPSTEQAQSRYPGLNALREHLNVRAGAAVPLHAGSRVIGGLAFGFPAPRSFDADDRAFLQALGRQCAQALERARLYEAEHGAREAAEAASRAKSQFVAMMSHELRTPLAAILGYEELLAEGIAGPINERQALQLQRIRASATHLRDLINQILSLSRIEAGKEEAFLEEVELGELARDVATLLEREIEDKGLRFSLAIPEESVEVETDPAKVRQILLNLVSNALKFTDEGEVAVELVTDGGQAVVRVRDTGIGIAPEDRERIFDAFTQVDQSMTRRVGGSGLGLSVSRRLARLLGGSLELESVPDQGSTFELRLPLRR